MAMSNYLITKGHHTEVGVKYYFVSNGRSDIIKSIDYSYSSNFENKKIYNLAFGDYNAKTDGISDDVNTENGDVYKVFNTVLSTIPLFFQSYPNSMMIVKGSDSSPQFIEKCKLACRRKCAADCKKSHRRIKVYCGYINRNYHDLRRDFTFYGGIDTGGNHIVIEDYIVGKKYDAVFVTIENA